MHRQSSLRQLASAFVGLLILAATARAQGPVVHLADATKTLPTTLPVQGKVPVLFVHGHQGLSAIFDNTPGYKKNWQDAPAGLSSFKKALDSPRNEGLGIEQYYIELSENDDRSIDEDAREIGQAVELILQRHDPEYLPQEHPTTNVQVVIIAYSQGTISTRLYLKNLEAEGRSFRPVSEFIAISPPNHGISTGMFAQTNSLAVKQLYNGMKPDHTDLVGNVTHCTDSFNESDATNYIKNLNNHAIADSATVGLSDFYEDEAPDSRADFDLDSSVPNPTSEGTLYLTIFATGNRDLVGGLTPSTDCVTNDGRKLARNLARDAVNIEVSEITDEGWEDIPQFLGRPTDTQRRAAAIHANTVHTPEVICRALYAAIHHRAPPQNLKCAVDSDGHPILPRAAAMLTLDFSASMALATGPDSTRASVLKEAVELFIRLWSAVSVPSDRIGVNYFRTNVEQFPSTGPALQPLSTGGDPLIINMRDQQQPRDSTAMGNGLQRAIEQLRDTAADATIRRVILFTDGMQNVNPMARIVNNKLTFVNESGRPNSNVSATAPSSLDPLLGIAVDTIGIGASDLGLLQDIAEKTGGRSKATTDIDMLRQFFVEELINALKGFSPQLVAYRRGSIGSTGISREGFAVEDGPSRVVLKLSWKRGDSMGFSVRKDDVDVTAAGRSIDGAFYKIFVIDLPAKGGRPIKARGNWEVRIKGKAATGYETAAIVDGGRITYDTLFNASQPKVGEPLELVVRTTANGRPLAASARVTATLMIPTSAVSDIIAAKPSKELPVVEAGMTDAEHQTLVLAQDPAKWARLRPRRQTVVLRRSGKDAFSTQLRPQVPGVYTAIATIDGDAPKIGKFSRTQTVTAVVRKGEPGRE